MTWRDKATIEAIGQYLKLLTILVLGVLMIWMFASKEIDLPTLLKVLIGTLLSDMAATQVVARRKP